MADDFKHTLDAAKKRADDAAAKQKREEEDAASAAETERKKAERWLNTVVLPILREAKEQTKGDVDFEIDETAASSLRPAVQFTLKQTKRTRGGPASVSYRYCVINGSVLVDNGANTIQSDNDVYKFNGPIDAYGPEKVSDLVNRAIDRLYT